MIIYRRAKSENDLRQILALQKKNMPRTLTAEERKQEGFVTVVHTMDVLSAMNKVCPHIIATLEDAIIGYALCMHPKFADSVEVLRPMFKEIDTIRPAIKRYMVMGQICIEKQHRGKGVFRQLYHTMGKTVKTDFDYIITEVDASNQRSLRAHYRVGFSDLKTYPSKGQEWKLISLPMVMTEKIRKIT